MSLFKAQKDMIKVMAKNQQAGKQVVIFKPRAVGQTYLRDYLKKIGKVALND